MPVHPPCTPLLPPAVGGNHEAANYLWELYYGGWAAPNIYFLGYAGVVSFGGVRIGGLSGIYKDQHYALVGAARVGGGGGATAGAAGVRQWVGVGVGVRQLGRCSGRRRRFASKTSSLPLGRVAPQHPSLPKLYAASWPRPTLAAQAAPLTAPSPRPAGPL